MIITGAQIARRPFVIEPCSISTSFVFTAVTFFGIFRSSAPQSIAHPHIKCNPVKILFINVKRT
jgi:hypothetical protein